MPRFALRIDYDGAPFQGWQRQAQGRPSVQAAIEDALARLEPGPHRIAAAGRTDTGVHATGQVAHCDLARPWDPFRLAEALNAQLRPLPVAITACAAVPEDFHARFSARERRYLYRILARRAPPVLDRGQVWHLRHPLDAAAMRAAADRLIGRHDFTTFRAAQCQANSPVRTLDDIGLHTHPAPGGAEFRLTFRARSFLHNQVRSMVGAIERAGAGALAPDDITRALDARNRAACPPVAPPHGLVLTGAGYDPDPFA